MRNLCAGLFCPHSPDMGRGLQGSQSQAARSKTVARPRAGARLHRHHGADGVTHDEHELRFLRPKRFEVPGRLAGLPFAETKPNPHRDWYFDALVDGTAALRAARCSMRVRRRADGSLTATFKIKLSTDGARTVRREIEHQLFCPACDQRGCLVCQEPSALLSAASGPAIEAARSVIGDRPFAHLFTVLNDRVDHHYRDEDGNHLCLSEDRLTYPDGSGEQRVEVEHVAGSRKLLDRAEKELRGSYRKIRAAPRGKLSEARKRMHSLLTA
jgi:hypothetical protein